MKKRQRPQQVPGSLIESALPQVNDPKMVQLARLTGLVTGLQVDGQCLSVVLSRLRVTATAVIRHAEASECSGLADPVAIRAAEDEGLPEMRRCLGEAALSSVGRAEHRQCSRFGGPVAGLRGGAAGMTVDGGGVREVADIQVAEDR